jgi:hypothetical protein
MWGHDPTWIYLIFGPRYFISSVSFFLASFKGVGNFQHMYFMYFWARLGIYSQRYMHKIWVSFTKSPQGEGLSAPERPEYCTAWSL